MSTKQLIYRIVDEEQTTRFEICDRRGASLGSLAPITRYSLKDAEPIGRLTQGRKTAVRNARGDSQ